MVQKTFFHLLDIAMLNAYNMFRANTGKKSSMRLSSKAVVKQIITKYGSPVSKRGGRQNQGQLDRLSAGVFMQRHYPCPLPLTDKYRRNQRDCYVCMNTEKCPKQRKSVTTDPTSCAVNAKFRYVLGSAIKTTTL